MIDRRNWQDVKEHMEFRVSVHQDAERTQQTRESLLRLLLIWADDTSLTRAQEIRPPYPQYLARQKRDGDHLSHSTQQSAISTARTFFSWAVAAHPRRYKRITQLWMDALQPVKAKSGIKERKAYSLEDMRAMMAVDDDRLIMHRIKAAAALMFLSGIRVGAFVTLPIKAIDLEHRRIRQWTELGVKTKFSKSATTFLLDIPDLMAIVETWDCRVRSKLDYDDNWFANVEGVYGRHVVPTRRESPSASPVYRHLRELCDLAGVTYMSPHKLRHGFTIHALSNAQTPADWKAISQNLMHSNLSTTDEIYGILKDGEVGDRIARLGGAHRGNGNGHDGEMSKAEIMARIQELVAQLQ